MKTISRTPRNHQGRTGAPRWRLAMTAAALFATSVFGGFLATRAAGGIDASTTIATDTTEPRPARVIVDAPARNHGDTGDDHGHHNPVLDLDVYPDQVRRSPSGREVLEFEVAITARAALAYSYHTAIEDDRGRSLGQQAPGPDWSLAGDKSALHPFAMPDDLGPGFYKAIFTASARSSDQASDQSRSVFFRVDSRGSVTPMDRIEWLEQSQATQGTSTPLRTQARPSARNPASP